MGGKRVGDGKCGENGGRVGGSVRTSEKLRTDEVLRWGRGGGLGRGGHITYEKWAREFEWGEG